MKRIFLVALIALSAIINTNGQGKAITLNGSDATTDTITNAGTTYLTSGIMSSYKSGNFTVTLKTTNVSGTSTYKAIIQGSLNGTDWTNIHQVAGTNGINCDTLQVTATAPAFWGFSIHNGEVKSVTDSTFLYTNSTRYLYYRIMCVGTGTQVTIISGQILPND